MLTTHLSNAEVNYKLYFTSTSSYIFMALYVSKRQLYITIILQGIAHSKQSICILYWNIVLICFYVKMVTFFTRTGLLNVHDSFRKCVARM